MKLSEGDALRRLSEHRHGALCTVHPQRGVDAVPCVYVVDDGHVGVPIDQVKPKQSSRLQRERNLDADPRATLLIDHWDSDDWSQLWWVRAELRWLGDATDATGDERGARLATRLAQGFTQYATQPFTRVLVFDIVAVTGWAGSDG